MALISKSYDLEIEIIYMYKTMYRYQTSYAMNDNK